MKVLSIKPFEEFYYYNFFPACETGKYRSLNDPPEDCLPCPLNTIGNAENASICECIENHFRNDTEGPEIDCTGKF